MGITLALSPYPTSTASAVAGAASKRGMDVVSLSGPTPSLKGRSALYAARLFGHRVSSDLDLALTEPPPGWLASLPAELTQRYVELTKLEVAWRARRPLFVKPADGKSFPPRVYPDGTYLPGADAFDPTTPVLVSERLSPLVEYRAFLLDGDVLTTSRYATEGHLDVAALEGEEQRSVLSFLGELPLSSLPSAVVVDVAHVCLPDTSTPWVVVEANAAWSSGIYACDPDRVLDDVIRGAGPASLLVERDRPFLRSS